MKHSGEQLTPIRMRTARFEGTDGLPRRSEASFAHAPEKIPSGAQSRGEITSAVDVVEGLLSPFSPGETPSTRRAPQRAPPSAQARHQCHTGGERPSSPATVERRPRRKIRDGEEISSPIPPGERARYNRTVLRRQSAQSSTPTGNLHGFRPRRRRNPRSIDLRRGGYVPANCGRLKRWNALTSLILGRGINAPTPSPVNSAERRQQPARHARSRCLRRSTRQPGPTGSGTGRAR
jgi:hypothetical protein